MNTPSSLPSPSSGRMLLLVTPAAALAALFEMVARMALQGPLYVLDAGNVFQGYALARALRGYTADIHPLLDRVMLSRVFTCYQLETLLNEATFESRPLLVLDLLSTFYDQGVWVADRRRLLQNCLCQLSRMSRAAPTAVWVRQRATFPQEGLSFLSMVRGAAGQVWTPEPLPPAPARQLSLLP